MTNIRENPFPWYFNFAIKLLLMSFVGHPHLQQHFSWFSFLWWSDHYWVSSLPSTCIIHCLCQKVKYMGSAKQIRMILTIGVHRIWWTTGELFLVNRVNRWTFLVNFFWWQWTVVNFFLVNFLGIWTRDLLYFLSIYTTIFTSTTALV